jgi:D-psicose/D-tagatose/L-ribulose 3-epimerase
MKLSMNLLLWGTQMDESMFPTLELIKEIGFDAVEVPLFDPNPANWESWRKKLDELGLGRQCDTFCGAELNLISPDAAVRKAGLDFLKNCVDCAVTLGAQNLMGPYHSALGIFTGQPATETEWKYGIEGIQELAEYAQNQKIKLCLEYLNRFELYLTSCGDELIQFVDDVNHPNCQIMFDTFHANIEEKSIGDCIRSMGDRIAFVQLSENDRSTPGKGNVDWAGTFAALQDINYQGTLSIEAFSQKLPAANIWRKMFVSEEQLMRDGLAFIKQNVWK